MDYSRREQIAEMAAIAKKEVDRISEKIHPEYLVVLTYDGYAVVRCEPYGNLHKHKEGENVPLRPCFEYWSTKLSALDRIEIRGRNLKLRPMPTILMAGMNGTILSSFY
jgi:hypothetical protein